MYHDKNKVVVCWKGGVHTVELLERGETRGNLLQIICCMSERKSVMTGGGG